MLFHWFRNRLPLGRRSEALAAGFLKSQGCRLVASPYKCRSGEVDIIAWDGPLIVFVEVKARRSTDAPEDAVTAAKRVRIIRAAREYLRCQCRPEPPYRYDIIAVNYTAGDKPVFRWIQDAFRER